MPQMEAFNHLMLEYPGLLYSGVGATAFLGGGALIYKFVTRYECVFIYLPAERARTFAKVVYSSRLRFKTKEQMLALVRLLR